MNNNMNEEKFYCKECNHHLFAKAYCGCHCHLNKERTMRIKEMSIRELVYEYGTLRAYEYHQHYKMSFDGIDEIRGEIRDMEDEIVLRTSKI